MRSLPSRLSLATIFLRASSNSRRCLIPSMLLPPELPGHLNLSTFSPAPGSPKQSSSMETITLLGSRGTLLSHEFQPRCAEAGICPIFLRLKVQDGVLDDGTELALCITWAHA